MPTSRSLATAPYIAWIGAPLGPRIIWGTPETRPDPKLSAALAGKMHGHARYGAQRREVLSHAAGDAGAVAHRFAEKATSPASWRFGHKRVTAQSLYLYAVPKALKKPELNTESTPWPHEVVAGLFDTTTSSALLLQMQQRFWQYSEQDTLLAVGTTASGKTVLLMDRRQADPQGMYITRHAVLETLNGPVIFDEPYALFDLEDRD